ncbi:MAG: hypothetical protein LM601_08820, partial [Candidatus Verstraetearchaeota archaeon]|nr:hypothetical protein [Candidatus Verstraetearchaeota archaeon]
MSELCKWLHERLEELPLIRYPFRLDLLPECGVYFFYEDGEVWGHGGDKLRIVRVGTHKGGSLRNRIAEHYLLGKYERQMYFDRNRPKPSDRSIFRKNIGRALLNRNNDSYLEIWNIKFVEREDRERYGFMRNINKEKELEEKITRIIRERFSFRFIVLNGQAERIMLERALIGTLASCKLCRPSENWLGNYSPIPEIRESGLWLTQH